MAARIYDLGESVPGTQYKVVRLLGEGGFGAVYVVEHTFLEARAVLKILHAELGDRTDLAQRMHDEAKALAKIRHPNIVEVRDGGMTAESPPRPYFVMEWLSGDTLAQVLHEMPRGLGIRYALRLVELLDGLDEAHTKWGVIHRDIKPANIFIHSVVTGPSGQIAMRPKLLDFGIAHFVAQRDEKRMTGQRFMGTMRYSAPEQLRGERPTPKVDIYAMGLVLYESICGRGPFDGAKDLGMAHLHNDPPPLSSFARVPDDLEAVIMSMLAKSPDQRPRSAAMLAAALREIRFRMEKESSVETALVNDTVPTPMDSRLITMSVARSEEQGRPSTHSTSPAAPEARRHANQAGALSDTQPDGPPLAAVNPGLTNIDAVPMGGQRSVQASRPEVEQRTADGEPVDRYAATPTQKPVPLPPPRHNTAPIGAADQHVDDVYLPPETSDEFGGPAAVRPAHGVRPDGTPSSTSGAVVSASGKRFSRPRPNLVRVAQWTVLLTVAVALLVAIAVVARNGQPTAAGPSAATYPAAATTAASPPPFGTTTSSASASSAPSARAPRTR